MASYDLIASYSTVQVLSPTLVNDIVYCTIQTSPSNVIASHPVQQNVFDSGTAGPELTNFANAIEEIMGINYVIAGVGSQQIDSSGLLVDYVTFTIRYPADGSGGNTVTTEADVPIGLLDFSDGQIGSTLLHEVETITLDAYNNLKNAAGG